MVGAYQVEMMDVMTTGIPRILCIEDDEALAEVFVELLTEPGYEVVPRRALPAIAELLVIRPDLIVLDLVFRGQATGLDFLADLRRQPDLIRLPVIVCSAAVEFLRAHRDCLDGFGVTVVPKPFDVDTLLETTARLLAPRSALARFA